MTHTRRDHAGGLLALWPTASSLNACGQSELAAWKKKNKTFTSDFLHFTNTQQEMNSYCSGGKMTHDYIIAPQIMTLGGLYYQFYRGNAEPVIAVNKHFLAYIDEQQRYNIVWLYLSWGSDVYIVFQHEWTCYPVWQSVPCEGTQFKHQSGSQVKLNITHKKYLQVIYLNRKTEALTNDCVQRRL